jgi:hypothetical protein
MLRLARVVDVHPEDHSVDLVMIEDGTRVAGVQVLTSSATGNTGVHDLPTPARPAGADKWEIASPTDRDMIAVVGSVGRSAIVVGFLFPQVSQMLFKDPNRRVMRHASDVYTSIDGQGNTEFFHPSGAYVRFGTSASHEDLSGADVDGKWAISKNTGNQVHIHIEQAGGKASVNIAPNGAIVVNSQSTLDFNITGNTTAVIGGNLSATVSGTTTVTSSGLAKVIAPTVTLDTPTTNCTGNLNVTGTTTTGGLVSTGAAGGGGATITGAVTVNGATTLNGNLATTGTLTNNGKSVGSTHTHSGVQTGGGTTGTPV